MAEIKEPWFQLHLATCIVMMLSASLLMAVYAPLVQTFVDTFGPEYPPQQVWSERILIAFSFIPGILLIMGVAWACEWWIQWRTQLDQRLAAASGLAARAASSHQRLLMILQPARSARPQADPLGGEQTALPPKPFRLHLVTALVMTIAVLALMGLSRAQMATLSSGEVGWPLPWYKDAAVPYSVVFRSVDGAAWNARVWYPLYIGLDVAGYLVTLGCISGLSEWLMRSRLDQKTGADL